MSFHLGKPILVMIVVALVAAALTGIPAKEKKADLTLWVFAEQHRDVYKSILDDFRKQTGVTVDVQLVSATAMDLRLSSLFMTDPTSPELPDLTEIEIGWVGKYFRPPVDQVGFLPLNNYLRNSGWEDKIVKQRLAPWTKEDTIFGVPHDVHPVTVMFREDLYRQAGVDLEAAKTWPEFHEKCLAFEKYWRQHGYPHRHAVQAGIADTSLVQMILLQRHLNLVDQYSHVHISDPKVAQTIAFYAQMVSGPKAVGGQSNGGQGGLSKDITDGNLCAFFTPDWLVTYIKKYSPDVAGKMRMMPLPKFDPTDAPTTTWGGTMIGITKACRHPDAAWKLIEFLYFSDEGLAARRRISDILPPVKSVWNEPRYHQPDPYFALPINALYWHWTHYHPFPATPGGTSDCAKADDLLSQLNGQKSAEMFIELGREVPERYQTPASTIAAASLAYVLNDAVDYVDEHHGSAGLQAEWQKSLDLAAVDLQRRIAHWSFE